MGDAGATYRLGDAARKAHLTINQARNYVQFRLVPSCARTPAGHMRFDEEAVRRLRLIGRALLAGLSMQDIRRFLETLDAEDCGALQRSPETVLARVNERRAVLDRLVRELNQACASPERYQAKGCRGVRDIQGVQQ